MVSTNNKCKLQRAWQEIDLEKDGPAGLTWCLLPRLPVLKHKELNAVGISVVIMCVLPVV